MKRILAHRRQLDPSRHEIAADWAVREDEGRLSPAQKLARDEWLEADAANRQALEDVRLALSMTAEIASDPEIMAARAGALAAAPQRDPTLPRVAAALFAAVLFGGTWWAIREGIDWSGIELASAGADTALYRTNVGERTTIALPDGSTAALDTDSAIRLDYSGTERGVRLLRGQALFEVAKNQALPFHVYAGQHRVAAIGTQFDVRMDGEGGTTKVRVALVKGVVNVARLRPAQDSSTPKESITMAAGEVLEVRGAEPMRVFTADTQMLTSWSAGLLIFDDTPLDEAVAEVNRYTHSPVTLADPKLSRLRLSGVFKVGLPKHFAETVADTFALAVAYKSDGSPELKPR